MPFHEIFIMSLCCGAENTQPLLFCNVALQKSNLFLNFPMIKGVENKIHRVLKTMENNKHSIQMSSNEMPFTISPRKARVKIHIWFDHLGMKFSIG